MQSDWAQLVWRTVVASVSQLDEYPLNRAQVTISLLDFDDEDTDTIANSFADALDADHIGPT